MPPGKVTPYIRDLKKLYDKFGLRGAMYGHIGQGCIHSRISFDLRSEGGVLQYRKFLAEAAELVVFYGGSLSGEHGDGQQRAEFLVKQYGPELLEAMRQFKRIWDPEWKMNPGKIIDPYPVDAYLKLGANYSPMEVKTKFHYPEDGGSFAHATVRCVGVGKCRQPHGADVMCPSYMVTRDEKHSTRGRARMLFEMMQGDVIEDGWQSEEVHDALELCLACKGCTHDCPVHVDMPTYKASFSTALRRSSLSPPESTIRDDMVFRPFALTIQRKHQLCSWGRAAEAERTKNSMCSAKCNSLQKNEKENNSQNGKPGKLFPFSPGKGFSQPASSNARLVAAAPRSHFAQIRLLLFRSSHLQSDIGGLSGECIILVQQVQLAGSMKSSAANVHPFGDEIPPELILFGCTPDMAAIRESLQKIANTNIPVLIEGESGTGKELICKYLHRLSVWSTGPFVKVNCPAIPNTLVESELFGYEKGAFTGAFDSKPGRVEMAHCGTLFLDEISELDLSLQSKLLQLLQDGQFCRIGASEGKKVDVRVICATNRQLHREVINGRFRQDLYYRITGLVLQLAALAGAGWPTSRRWRNT